MPINDAPNHRRLPNTVASRLQRGRIAANLRQSHLAARANVSRETIRQLEAGAHVPTVKTAVAISRALGYSNPLDLFRPLDPFPDLEREPPTEDGLSARLIAIDEMSVREIVDNWNECVRAVLGEAHLAASKKGGAHDQG